MKIIAIFDFDEFPNTCKECPKHEGEGYFYCPLIHGSHGSLAWYFNGDKERNPYCPLKPMLEKLHEVSYDSWWGWNKIFDHVIEGQIKVADFAKGWNACLDEITGDTE